MKDASQRMMRGGLLGVLAIAGLVLGTVGTAFARGRDEEEVPPPSTTPPPSETGTSPGTGLSLNDLAGIYDTTVDLIQQGTSTGAAGEERAHLRELKARYLDACRTLDAETRALRGRMKNERPKPHKPANPSRTWLRDWLGGLGYPSDVVSALLREANSDSGEFPINNFGTWLYNRADYVRRGVIDNGDNRAANVTPLHEGAMALIHSQGRPSSRTAYQAALRTWEEFRSFRDNRTAEA